VRFCLRYGRPYEQIYVLPTNKPLQSLKYN